MENEKLHCRKQDLRSWCRGLGVSAICWLPVGIFQPLCYSEWKFHDIYWSAELMESDLRRAQVNRL